MAFENALLSSCLWSFSDLFLFFLMFKNLLVGDCVALSKGFNLVRRNSAISLSSSFSLVEKRKINLLRK